MASNPFPIILLDGVTGTGAGPIVGNAEQMRFGNKLTVPNQNQFNWYTKVFLTFTEVAAGAGAAATVQFQDSADGSAFTTRYTAVLTIPSAAPYMKALCNGNGVLFKTMKRYIRLNVSALSGGNTPVINAYGSLGGYGA